MVDPADITFDSLPTDPIPESFSMPNSPDLLSNTSEVTIPIDYDYSNTQEPPSVAPVPKPVGVDSESTLGGDIDSPMMVNTHGTLWWADNAKAASIANGKDVVQRDWVFKDRQGNDFFPKSDSRQQFSMQHYFDMVKYVNMPDFSQSKLQSSIIMYVVYVVGLRNRTVASWSTMRFINHYSVLDKAKEQEKN